MGPPPASGPAAPIGAPTTSPCDACDARCCSAYAVHVTGDDVRRIAEETGLAPHAFVTWALQAERTATGFVVRPGGPSHDLLLAHARAGGSPRPCPFLRAEDGRTPRCGIYAFRPRVCRRFPAVRMGDGYGARDGIVCGPGAWARHDLARLSWRVAIAREEREAEAYAAVVAAWNERVERGAAPDEGLLGFLDYLGDAYRWLARWRAALPPADRAGPAFRERIRRTLRACPP
jgi:Fe-S-cluster containining protein